MKSEIPINYKYIEEAMMSNFDHIIDENVAAQLRDQPCYSQYSGWDFCGYVWCVHSEQKYKCEVWTWKEPREIIEADSLEEIMDIVSDKYGGE